MWRRIGPYVLAALAVAAVALAAPHLGGFGLWGR